MTHGTLHQVVAHARRIAAKVENTETPDRQLVDAFVRKRDEQSFTALVHRHGPMVLGVCNRLLHDSSDAEDVFQATFLVLACKAASIRESESTGSWLHGVAVRAARRFRIGEARRRRRESKSARPEIVDPADTITWKELRAVLDDELGRIDRVYRAPLILCYLDGYTQDEAAHRLGCSKSTLRRRLELGRTKLQRQLARRDVTLSAGLAPAWLSVYNASSSMTPELTGSTVLGALQYSAGRVAHAGMRPIVYQIADSLLRTLAVSKLIWISTSLLASSLFLASAGFLVLRIAGGDGIAQSRAGITPHVVDEPIKPLAKENEGGLPSVLVQGTPPREQAFLGNQPVEQTGTPPPTATDQPLDKQSVPEATFSAIQFTKTGKYAHEVSAAYGEFTLAGPKVNSLKPLPEGIRHVAFDPVGKQMFGVSSHEFYKIDLARSAKTELKPPADLPELSWTCGIAFDTKRERVVVLTLGGGGHLYSYIPKTGQWAVITEMRRIGGMGALTYDAKTDLLYGLCKTHDSMPNMTALNAHGAVVNRIELSNSVFPSNLEPQRMQCPPQLIVVGGDLVVFAEDRVFSIDLKTEKVKFDVDFKIAELIRRLGAGDSNVVEEVAAKLLKLGKPASALLQQALRQSNTVEVRRRALQVVNLLEERRLNSRMHVVGIHVVESKQYLQLAPSPDQDLNWVRLSEVLVDQGKKDTPTPGKRIWDLLPEQARAIVADKTLVDRISAYTQKPRSIPPDRDTILPLIKFKQGLEEVLRRQDFYQEQVFATVKLDEEGKQLRGRFKDLSMLEMRVFNHRLLEASFPGHVQKCPFTLETATVPVRVMATKEPITLVLCSYNSVRWLIRPDKGAKIKQVIVGGYHVQDVAGTNAPVTYCVYESPRKEGEESLHFFAYKQDDEHYPEMVDALRKLTGREITTFQGRYSYQGGPPFIVGTKE